MSGRFFNPACTVLVHLNDLGKAQTYFEFRITYRKSRERDFSDKS